MDGDNIARVIYLVLLGSALLMWFITHNRQNLSRTMQQAAAWVLIFVGVIAAVGLWEDVRTTVSPAPQMVVSDSAVEVPRAPDGHYYLQLLINGKPVTFLVDTGASQVVLNHRDAERVGIDVNGLNYFGRAMTANGQVRTAPVRLDSIALGPFTDTGLSAWVNEGDMNQSLLGMDYLQRFSHMSFANGKLILQR